MVYRGTWPSAEPGLREALPSTRWDKSPVLQPLTAPASASILLGPNITLAWNAGNNAQAYWLYVGSTVNGPQYHNSCQLTAGPLSSQVTGRRTTGKVFVRLWSRQGSEWRYNDYTYKGMAGGLSLSFAPGTPAQAQSAL